MRLLPKDETFWEFFTKGTAALSLASDILAVATKEGPGRMAAAAVRIKSLERESALRLQDLRLRLHKTFVTPIDPEDISLLFDHLDRMLDYLEALSYRLAAYQLNPVPPLMVELAGRIHCSAELIEKAFGFLSIGESTEGLCKEIAESEEQTDLAIREGVTRLFDEEKDNPALLKKREIYALFERLSSSTQDLANALQNVSIKNS